MMATDQVKTLHVHVHVPTCTLRSRYKIIYQTYYRRNRPTVSVCSFLASRHVSPRIIENFRDQKIDGKVVKLLSDVQFADLGLTAIRDKVTLKHHCVNAENSETTGASAHFSQPGRRKQLLQLLRKPTGNRLHVPEVNKTSNGRPKKTERTFSFGLRISDEKCNSLGDRLSNPVKSPLGDKNTIYLSIPMNEEYYKVLSLVKEAFFPSGKNPVIGEEDEYLLEIVNCRNQNVRKGVNIPFTFAKYLEEKKVPGTPKCYMLCTELNSSESETLPVFDLTGSHPQPVHLDSSPSHGQASLSGDLPASLQSAPNLQEQSLQADSSDCEYTSDCESPVRGDHLPVTLPGTPIGEVLLRIPQHLPDNFINDNQLQWQTVQECVDGTIRRMKECGDPIEVLGFYQKIIHQGRALETLSGEFELTEGEANPIFVSRFNLWETGIQELLQLQDANCRLPLDVTFYAELAQDLGGPRREFLTLMTKEALSEERKIFSKCSDDNGYEIYETSANVRNKAYFATGLLAGISMLQQGPLLSFLSEKQIQKLLHEQEVNLCESERQFRAGLNCLGIVDLAVGIPSFVFLLRATAQKELNHRQLIHLLKPDFSEKGSNNRQSEENIYSHFVSYLREVSAGRRSGITLAGILMFVTGAEQEPPLGFQNHPTITFDDLPLFLPRAQTCICQLTLSRGHDLPSKKTLYDSFDMAFANFYFGVM